MIGVYAIVHLASGSSYVGRSTRIEERWARHRTDLDCSRHHARGLQRAWDKHGGEAFEFLVLEECSRGQLAEREAHWLALAPKPLNNMRPTDMAGVLEHGPETRAKMSASQKARGYKPSAEHVVLMQQRRKEIVGYNWSDETRRRMSEAAKRKAPPGPETRKLLREANYRREYRRVRRLTDGAVFRSVAEAGRAHGITNGAICNAIKRGKKSAGHMWEYASGARGAGA